MATCQTCRWDASLTGVAKPVVIRNNMSNSTHWVVGFTSSSYHVKISGKKKGLQNMLPPKLIYLNFRTAIICHLKWAWEQQCYRPSLLRVKKCQPGGYPKKSTFQVRTIIGFITSLSLCNQPQWRDRGSPPCHASLQSLRSTRPDPLRQDPTGRVPGWLNERHISPHQRNPMLPMEVVTGYTPKGFNVAFAS